LCTVVRHILLPTPTTARPRVSSRAIHNEEKSFHHRPNINLLAESSNWLPRYLLHQRDTCRTCHEKRCSTLRRLQDGMEAELPIKPSIWARTKTHAKRIHTVYTTTTNKTPSTRISYKPCSKSVYIPFRLFIFPGVFIQVSTSPSYRKNAYTHTSARLVVHQRPFSISLSTSKHHHTLFTRSTLRDLPSQLGQHAYGREQH
jgi:hypothetical protein